MSPELELRLRKCSTLPTLSAVAIEVLQRCQDENLDFHQIAEVIGHDPALSIKGVEDRKFTDVCSAAGGEFDHASLGHIGPEFSTDFGSFLLSGT